MAKNTRKMKTNLEGEISGEDLEGEVTGTIEHLHDIVKRYTPHEVRLSFNPASPDFPPTVQVWTVREETDDEMKARLAEERKAKRLAADARKRLAADTQADEAKERALLAKLLEKYPQKTP